jgi:hypothetical protein
MIKVMLVVMMLAGISVAQASDVGTASKAICEAKGMVFVKASKNGRRNHCRAKAGTAKAVK